MPKIILQVTVAPPEGAKLAELAESTSTAFLVLLPWCTAPPANSSTALLSIVTQAQRYVRAIDHSIVAAQDGFNIAEEAINLANLFQDVPRTTDEDYTEYLSGMVDMASRGQQNANAAVDGFRSVRRTIESLIRDARDERGLSEKGDTDLRSSDGDDLNRLEGSIDKLEKFSNSVSEYIKWWNFMQMSGEAQRARSEQLVFRYDSLRERAVINKWIELRKEYMHYQEKISLLQDKYREYKWLSTWPIASPIERPKSEVQFEEIRSSDAESNTDVPVEAVGLDAPPREQTAEVEQAESLPELDTNLGGECEEVRVDPGLTTPFIQDECEVGVDTGDSSLVIHEETVGEGTIQKDEGISEHEEEVYQLDERDLGKELRHEDVVRLEEESAEALQLEEDQTEGDANATDQPEMMLTADHSSLGVVNVDELQEITDESFHEAENWKKMLAETVIEQRVEEGPTLDEKNREPKDEGNHEVKQAETRERSLEETDKLEKALKEHRENEDKAVKQSSNWCKQCIVM